ncbi:hypothetical protein [Bacillus cereus]|uniref:hypothetical protein n=1 Tax=Bacillus cereus TaxID=1396 RepID=UPI003D65754D
MGSLYRNKLNQNKRNFNNKNSSCSCSKNCCEQCRSCQCSSCDNICGEGLIQINIYGFNTSGFSYVISQGGKGIERAVSFSAFGINFNPENPFVPNPRTISGIIRRDGTIPPESEGFTVSHVQNTGTYRVTFTKQFSIVSPDQDPTVEIIPDPVNAQVCCNNVGITEDVSDVISGLISSEGVIMDGTLLENSQEYAFTVVKDINQTGYYRVRFRPELHVKTLLRAGIEINVIDIQNQSCGCNSNNCSCNCKCTCNCPCYGEVYSQGVELPFVDRSGFVYRPYQMTDVGKVYADLPVSFSALVIREETNC